MGVCAIKWLSEGVFFSLFSLLMHLLVQLVVSGVHMIVILVAILTSMSRLCGKRHASRRDHVIHSMHIH